jgi:hypothetical protein
MAPNVLPGSLGAKREVHQQKTPFHTALVCPKNTVWDTDFVLDHHLHGSAVSSNEPLTPP